MESRTGTGDNPLCGDTIKVFLAIDQARIVDAQWEGHGCELCLTCTDALMDSLIGLSLDEVNNLLEQESRNVNDDEGIKRTRKRCALLPLEAVRSVVSP